MPLRDTFDWWIEYWPQISTGTQHIWLMDWITDLRPVSVPYTAHLIDWWNIDHKSVPVRYAIDWWIKYWQMTTPRSVCNTFDWWMEYWEQICTDTYATHLIGWLNIAQTNVRYFNRQLDKISTIIRDSMWQIGRQNEEVTATATRSDQKGSGFGPDPEH